MIVDVHNYSAVATNAHVVVRANAANGEVLRTYAVEDLQGGEHKVYRIEANDGQKASEMGAAAMIRRHFNYNGGKI